MNKGVKTYLEIGRHIAIAANPQLRFPWYFGYFGLSLKARGCSANLNVQVEFRIVQVTAKKAKKKKKLRRSHCFQFSETTHAHFLVALLRRQEQLSRDVPWFILHKNVLWMNVEFVALVRHEWLW
jgi:hypothetical protein